MDDEIKERYKLKEAAKIITQGHHIAETNQILNKLEQSVRDGSLQVFQTGTNNRYEFGSNKESSEANELNLIRSNTNSLHGGFTWVDKEYDERLSKALYLLPDNLEAYWDDLNTWLKNNEQRISPIFQDPDTLDTPFADKKEAVKGLTKQQVIVAFEGLHFVTDEQWSRALANTPKWLEPCRVMKGNEKTSALWNPALIAVALLDKHVPIKKLDVVFIGLKDWTDEWQEVSEIFRD